MTMTTMTYNSTASRFRYSPVGVRRRNSEAWPHSVLLESSSGLVVLSAAYRVTAAWVREEAVEGATAGTNE